MPHFLDEARTLVSAFQEPEDDKSRELVLGLLLHSADPLSRHQMTPGHLTCTGVVIHPALDRVLLIHHARLNRWLLPGGHVEPEDPNPAAAARREVHEETAVLTTGAAFLAGLDVHGIPPKGLEPYHLHHDLKFALAATSDRFSGNEETRSVVWCRLDEFDSYSLPGSIRRAARRAAEAFRRL